MVKHLHIVSFDNPYPPSYGGVIDVFYKIKALHQAGIKISLHLFYKGELVDEDILGQYCAKVHTYPRLVGLQAFSFLRPYIVNSRKHTALLKNLLFDEDPILFEGLHTTYFINHPRLKDRKKYVRVHNVEHAYYEGLAASTSSIFKRTFFSLEAKRLKYYEPILKHADKLFALSKADTEYYTNLFSTEYIPVFHAHTTVESQLGKGAYCLYHGNLAVTENEQAARYLLEEVFSRCQIPLIIAGAHPSSSFLHFANSFNHVEIIENPRPSKLSELMVNAQVHVLYTSQDSGIKLKWVNALYQGRFILGNDKMLNDPILATVCYKANSSDEFVKQLGILFRQEFSQLEIDQRKIILERELNTAQGAEKIIKAIWP